MNKKFKSIILLLICFFIFFTAAACAKEKTDTASKKVDPPHTLRFNEDGKFKVIIFSDMHADYENGPSAMAAILDAEKPDLVIFGGDNISWIDKRDVEPIVSALSEPLAERGIKWCYVYGNHDRESVGSGYLQEVFLSQECCIASDVGFLDGEATYCLPVLSSDSDETAYAIWCMDSHDYAPELSSYYDCVHTDQIEWYKECSEKLEKTAGRKIYGLMFMHIPMQQLQYIRDNPEECKIEGDVNEPTCCSDLDYGLFDAIKERGDVKLVLNGHDHTNNYTGIVDGINFGYCGSLSLNTYNIEEIRGARVVIIDENDTEHPETYMAFLHDPKYGYDK